VTILIPELTVAKTANVSSTTPGSTVRFTISVDDTGPTAYTGATVTDPLGGVLSDAAYNNNATATSGTVSVASSTLTWTGDLAPGNGATITFTVTVNNPDTGDKRLVNTVTSAAAGSTCPAGSTDPGCTATVPVLVPALTITKTATVSTVTPGSQVGYTITVDNTGQTPYTAAHVTDSLTEVLADATYGNDAHATSGTVSFATPTLTWTGSLAIGDSATITYTVTVNSPDTGGRTLTNTAVSGGSGQHVPGGKRQPGLHRRRRRDRRFPDHHRARQLQPRQRGAGRVGQLQPWARSRSPTTGASARTGRPRFPRPHSPPARRPRPRRSRTATSSIGSPP